MKVSTAKHVFPFLFTWLSVLGCDSAPHGGGEEAGKHAAGNDPPAIDIRIAPLAITDCQLSPQRGLPPSVSRMVVTVADASGHVQFQAGFDRSSDGADATELLVEGVPRGKNLKLSIFACEGDETRMIGRAALPELGAYDKQRLAIELLRIERLSCPGTGQGAAFDQYAGLGRSRGFAATATLSDGTVLVVGGAGQLEGSTLTAEAGTADYDLYSPERALFLPSRDPSRVSRASMLSPRVGAHAFAMQNAAGQTQGVLVVGGAPRVEWADGALGPLSPVGGQLASPAAEYFDLRSETFVPVEGAEHLVPRFLPAAATGDGDILLAGGIEISAGCGAVCEGEPSASLEVIRDGAVYLLSLDQPRVGPSLTRIGPHRYLLWGGDLLNDGATPALIVDLSGLPATVGAVKPLSVSPEAGLTWRPTAYHAAIPLASADTGGRVLIVGGVGFLRGSVEGNPELGGQAGPANAFVVEIAADHSSAQVHAINIDGSVQPALKRALPGLAAVGNRVIVAGGWQGLAPTPSQLNGSDTIALYDDARPAGRFRPARDPTPTTMFHRRVGHTVVATTAGYFLIAGGVDRDSLTHAAEIFVPAPLEDLCR